VAAEVEPGDGHRDDDSQYHRAEQTDECEPTIERDMRAKNGEENGFNHYLLHDMPPARAH
jgi:hypothetical protein